LFRSFDEGVTWELSAREGTDLRDKPWMAVDRTGGIGDGNIYVVWSGIRFIRSTDGGSTFTDPPARSVGSSGVTVGPDGTVYVTWMDTTNDKAFEGLAEIFVARSDDGGATWNRVPPESLPPANPGEGSFAASGNCVVTHGDSTAWIGTGASPPVARILKTTNRGRSWTVVETPITGGPTSGITSVSFRDAQHGAALGGDFTRPDEYSDNVAVTDDGGQTWTLAGRPKLSGSVYGAVYVPGAPTPTLVGVGPEGIDYSIDNGMTWTSLDTLSHWSVAFASPMAGWAIGPEGRITKIKLFE
ncbi:MAG: exo-alpha-sialidase, partial [Bacteroidetes bacterium]|nr:exo-alpha-sialidase [Bacteroidota bacterium]